MKQFLVLTLLCLSMVFLGCESKLTVKKVIRRYYGKQVDFNWPMQYVYEDTLLDSIDAFEFSSIKVVVYVSRQLCVPCFSNYLSATKEYTHKLKSDSVQYICVMYPRPIEEIHDAMDSLELPQTLVIYDKEDQYLKKNSLEKYTDMFRTFLLDKNDRVVLVGDPLRSTKLQKLYTEKIQELIDNGGELPKKTFLRKKL